MVMEEGSGSVSAAIYVLSDNDNNVISAYRVLPYLLRDFISTTSIVYV